MTHIVYPKNKPAPVLVTDPEAPQIANPAGTDPENATLMNQIRAAPNKSELLIQFCIKADIEGTRTLIREFGTRCSYIHDNMKAWRTCAYGNAEQREICKMLLAVSAALKQAHLHSLHHALIMNDETCIKSLVQSMDKQSISCSDVRLLLTTACISCSFETITQLFQVRDSICTESKCETCGRNLLRVLYDSLGSNNMDVFEHTLALRSNLPAEEAYTDSRYRGNMDLVRKACLTDHKLGLKMLLENLPLNAADTDYLPDVLDSVTSKDDSEMADLVFGCIGDKLDPKLIKNSHLENACEGELLGTIKVLIAKHEFDAACINSCFDLCLTSELYESAACLFENAQRVLTNNVIDKKDSITDPVLRKLIHQRFAQLAEDYSQ